jgi:hypothetical protein
MSESVEKIAQSLGNSIKISDSFALPHPHSLPRTLTRSYTIHSIPTDLWVQIFGDCIIFGFSQLEGKVGSFIQSRALTSETSKTIDYPTANLLGGGDELHWVYARQLCQKVMELQSSQVPSDITIVLGISIQEKSPEMFRTIIDLLVGLYREALGATE